MIKSSWLSKTGVREAYSFAYLIKIPKWCGPCKYWCKFMFYNALPLFSLCSATKAFFLRLDESFLSFRYLLDNYSLWEAFQIQAATHIVYFTSFIAFTVRITTGYYIQFLCQVFSPNLEITHQNINSRKLGIYSIRYYKLQNQ